MKPIGLDGVAWSYPPRYSNSESIYAAFYTSATLPSTKGSCDGVQDVAPVQTNISHCLLLILVANHWYHTVGVWGFICDYQLIVSLYAYGLRLEHLCRLYAYKHVEGFLCSCGVRLDEFCKWALKLMLYVPWIPIAKWNRPLSPKHMR
jgi:hypothetical protein